MATWQLYEMKFNAISGLQRQFLYTADCQHLKHRETGSSEARECHWASLLHRAPSSAADAGTGVSCNNHTPAVGKKRLNRYYIPTRVMFSL